MDFIIDKRFNFSGGEVQVTVKKMTSDVVCITANLRSSDDVMALLMATDALRRQGATRIHLMMPYVPYARQDRVMNPGEALGIKVFCDLINAQNYSGVTILDPHSDVTPALLNNVLVIEQHELVQADMDLSDHILVCPDAGARKKIGKLAMLGNNEVVFFDKSRNTKTGAITGTVLSQAPVVWDRAADHLIVDDICEGGMTFIKLAEALREHGVTGNIDLYVTHAILSKGTAVFEGHINTLWTPSCWLSKAAIEQSNANNTFQIEVV